MSIHSCNLVTRNTRLLIGYGSGIVPQSSLVVDKSALLDFLVVVNNHKDYIRYLRLIGIISSSSATIARYIPNEVVYFPNIPICHGSQRMKLGVVSFDHFISRLEDWNNSFYIPGRMQKPTKLIFSEETAKHELELAQRANLQAALVSGIIMRTDLEMINDYELFRDIVSLSYMGDIRMGIAENPMKIDNIVSAQMEQIRELYKPFFNDVGLDTTDPSRWVCRKNSEELWNMLPVMFRRKAVQSPNFRTALIATLSNINRRESVYQAIGGLGTAGLSNSAKYLARKVSKRIFSF